MAELLKLRDAESDAFERFRKSLNTSVTEYAAQGHTFSETDAMNLYADVIAPELARLNNQVSTSRRKINKTGIAKIIGWTGAISFGAYLGFIPSELAAAAKALGLTKATADILEVFASRRSAQDEIRQEDLYFLWRVQHAAAAG